MNLTLRSALLVEIVILFAMPVGLGFSMGIPEMVAWLVVLFLTIVTLVKIGSLRAKPPAS